MYLMLQDKEVIYFDFDDFVVQIIQPDLVPFCMRYAFKDDGTPKSLLYNVQLLKSYLSRRVLSLSRDNAKQIYTLFGIPQLNDIDTRVQICIKTKGVSVQDSYWIREDDSKECFDSINIRKKHFKEIVDISLYGDNPSITTNMICPELTTQGLFRKAWVREEDGLYLLKSDRHSQNINTRMEVLASKILSCFSNKIDCIKYNGRFRQTKSGRLFVDKCKNFVDESHSFVEAWELIEFSNRIGKSFQNDILGFSKEASSIGVLDFILANTDRHTQNYGFWMDNMGRIAGLAPLFDFNCALVGDVFNKDVSDTLSQMFNSNITIRHVADFYKPYHRLVLDMNKFNKLRKNNKDYNIVFDRVLERCRYIAVKEI